ncbi:HAD-like protein [Tricholoma matsutake]|nr:HAD-like protein [Tricholoma matsutake 945]
MSSSGKPPTRSKIEYVIFDVDGLMIDSERVYTEVTNDILKRYDEKYEMTWDMKAGLMGKPERQAAEHLLSFFPNIPLTISDYLTQRNIEQEKKWPTVALLPGVRRLVLHLNAHNIPIAVATGSRRRNLMTKTAHLGEVFECFDDKIVCADDAKYNMNGKPAPDVFLTAARESLGRDVGMAGEQCTDEQKKERAKGLVFEDAIPGLQAGKRAGMSVVWVPDPNLLEVEYSGEEKADQTLRSIAEFVPEEWGLPPYDHNLDMP